MWGIRLWQIDSGPCLIGLVKASSGEILWDGKNLVELNDKVFRVVRRDIQMIFQDPLASLNPRMTIGEIIAEPLRNYEPGWARMR